MKRFRSRQRRIIGVNKRLLNTKFSNKEQKQRKLISTEITPGSTSFPESQILGWFSQNSGKSLLLSRINCGRFKAPTYSWTKSFISCNSKIWVNILIIVNRKNLWSEIDRKCCKLPALTENPDYAFCLHHIWCFAFKMHIFYMHPLIYCYSKDLKSMYDD